MNFIVRIVKIVFDTCITIINSIRNIKFTDYEECALFDAIKNNNIGLVIELLESENYEHQYSTALTRVAEDNKLEIVLKLLEHGVDVNNNEALKCAASNGHEEIIVALLEYGTKRRYVDKSALKWCEKMNAALLSGAKKGNFEIVTKLLEYNANIHTNEDAALRLGAEYLHYEVVSVLLERGADVQASDNDALKSSVRKGSLEIVTKLLEYGAKVPDDDLLISCIKATPWKTNIAIKLIEHGANVCYNNNYALRYAVNSQKFCFSLEIITKLLEYGADIHCCDDTILKNMSNHFNKRKAVIILPYCSPDGYHYFPDWFIKEMYPSIKSANKCDH